MIKTMLGCGVAVSLLALAACGGSIQDVGDAVSGSGGDTSAETRGGGSAQPLGGSTNAQSSGGRTSADSGGATHVGGAKSAAGGNGRGGAAGRAPGTCDPPCSEGFGCYTIADDPAGLCAPLCDTPEQGQTAYADLSCSHSVQGGAGQCVFSLGFGWPIPGAEGIPLLESDRFVTGLCSNPCDPIVQDCPAGYTCDMTDTFSAVNQQGLYACLPNKVPHALGESCQSTGDGECGPGLTCTLGNQGIFDAVCTTFCEMGDTDACPDGQTCTETEVTMQDNDPNIGVCL
jgi:hypothetical protein